MRALWRESLRVGERVSMTLDYYYSLENTYLCYPSYHQRQLTNPYLI